MELKNLKNTDSLNPSKLFEKINLLKSELSNSIFGQDALIDESICCLLASGHALITGAPGLAKTTLIKILAKKFNLDYKRIQFTPDVLPSDILGSQILDADSITGKRYFSFEKGPVFTNFLLADEINRASPKTQSALLEAMQEKHCTVAGEVFDLPKPFMVFATQNPLESDGTFVLPEAQLDRFLAHIIVDYPEYSDELKILEAHSKNNLIGESEFLEQDQKIILRDFELIECQKLVSEIAISERLLEVVLELIRKTRPKDSSSSDQVRSLVLFGGGPRAGISLLKTAKAYSYLCGDEEVRWKHIKRMAKPVLRHRVKISSEAVVENISEDEIIDQIINYVEKKYSNL